MRLWHKPHLTCDQTKRVVKQSRCDLRLELVPNGRSTLLYRNLGLRYLKASWLDRRRPELVFSLLIALVLPKDDGSSILNRPNVDLR